MPNFTEISLVVLISIAYTHTHTHIDFYILGNLYLFKFQVQTCGYYCLTLGYCRNRSRILLRTRKPCQNEGVFGKTEFLIRFSKQIVNIVVLAQKRKKRQNGFDLSDKSRWRWFGSGKFNKKSTASLETDGEVQKVNRCHGDRHRWNQWGQLKL